jgi:hypothetical protein
MSELHGRNGDGETYHQGCRSCAEAAPALEQATAPALPSRQPARSRADACGLLGGTACEDHERQSQRRVARRKRAAAGEGQELSLTDRLLAQILIELMETRGRQGYAAIAARFRSAGLSSKQVAAVLDTTPASLAVIKHRSEKNDD